MRVIIALIKKEFLQIFRNPILARILLIIPIMQLILLVYAANFEIKNLSLCFIDRDQTSLSHTVAYRLNSSGYFLLTNREYSYDIAMDQMDHNDIDLIVEIPQHFERDIQRGQHPHILVAINGVNSMKAALTTVYIQQIMTDLNIAIKEQAQTTLSKIEKKIVVTYSNWFNPMLSYRALMLPGVLCMIITVVGIAITSLNIVREKEIGTIEQLNVTPITKIQFIIGKIVPFGIIGIIQLSLGFLVALYLFDLSCEGSIILVYGVAFLYMLVVLGLGFFISTLSQTQSQSMFLTMFCIFLLILLCGLLTPLESMPLWAQYLNKLNPTAYLVEIFRLIILKGSTFRDMLPQILILLLEAIFINVLVYFRYRKVN